MSGAVFVYSPRLGVQRRLRAFLEGVLGHELPREAFFIGWKDADGLFAAVCYHDWQPWYGRVEVSVGTTRPGRWMTRPRLAQIFEIAYDGLGCDMVVARHDEAAHASRRGWRLVGAAEVIIPDMRGVGRGEVVTMLHKGAWLEYSERMRRGGKTT